MSSLSSQYSNWPDSLESKIPYKKPAKNTNPSINGLLLTVAAAIVDASSLVARFLYHNAGFPKLRSIAAIPEIKHRYDPAVIPLKSGQEVDAGLPDYNDARLISRCLVKQPGDGDTTPLYWSIRDYHEAYKNGDVTPLQIVNALLPLIRRDIGNSSEYSLGFISTRVDIVLAAAEASTKRWQQGRQLGILDGVPTAVKDEVDLAGYPQYIGTKQKFTDSTQTSWCALKWEQAGAIVMGKTNMHELGMDTTNNNTTFGTPKNPYNDRYYTGGSSGGSAYAVSMGLIPFALGTDGGGSIRIPSCYCGVFGLKPSHARVSERPTPETVGTTGVAGPIASTMEALEIAYRIMATPDPARASSSAFSAPRRLTAPRKKIIGFPRQWFDQADEAVRKACQAAVDWYASECGYEIVDVHVPLLVEGQLAHALTIMLECRNSLTDFKYLEPANRILMAVTSVSPAIDFLAAQKVRQVLMQHLGYLFDTYGKDLILVTPTTPNAGWSFKPSDLKTGISDGDMTIKNMTYVWLANFTGIPAIQFPVAYVPPLAGTGDIPVGLMGMGIWGGEEGLIEWGYQGESYLHGVQERGRLRSPKWVDVITKAKKTDMKPELNEEEAEQTNVKPGQAPAPDPVAT